MYENINKVVNQTIEENDNIRSIVRSTIKEMILDGDIRLEEITRDTTSNEGFNYGDQVLHVLSVDNEEQDYIYGLVVDKPEITGW